jgi:hypothetical protein
MVLDEPVGLQLDEIQLQLEGLARAIAEQRAGIERRDAAGVDRSEAEGLAQAPGSGKPRPLYAMVSGDGGPSDGSSRYSRNEEPWKKFLSWFPV